MVKTGLMRHETFPASETHEFFVVPAPRRGERGPGLRTDEDRMAATLTDLLNQMASEGWEYVRADMLPNQSSADLTGTSAKQLALLIFRRPKQSRTNRTQDEPLLLTDPVAKHMTA